MKYYDLYSEQQKSQSIIKLIRSREDKKRTKRRDFKLAAAEHFFFSLVEAKLRAAGSGARYVRISPATNPSASPICTHTLTHTLHMQHLVESWVACLRPGPDNI